METNKPSFDPAIFNSFGVNIICDDRLVDVRCWQVRFPRSKKKRIRRKWSQQKKNFRFEVKPKEDVFVIDNGKTMIMHTLMYERLKAVIQRNAIQKVADLAGMRVGEL